MTNRLQAPPNKYPRIDMRRDTEPFSIKVKTLDGGINNFNDPEDIADNEAQHISNFKIRGKKLETYPALEVSVDAPAKPDSKAVSLLYGALLFDDSNFQIRFGGLPGETTSVFRRQADSWVEITADGLLLQAPANNVVSTDNRHFFSNGGFNYIQELDLNASTYSRLGNAPKYRFVTSFYNRIVGANSTTNPIEVGWSGDFNFDEWDVTVDPSAGFAPLEESQSDYADFITGLYGFANQMIILRERSIWLANKTPGINPFYFYTAVPNLGSDTPNSIQKIPNGVVFYDKRTSSVYSYVLGGQLENIGEKLNKFFTPDNYLGVDLSTILPEDIKSGYDAKNMEYHLIFNNNGNIIILVYSFKSQAWWTLDLSLPSGYITSFNALDFRTPSTFIDDLVGTIDSLAGTINELGGVIEETSLILVGSSDGELYEFSAATNLTGLFASKVWAHPDVLDYYVLRSMFTFVSSSAGTLKIDYYDDTILNDTPATGLIATKTLTVTAESDIKNILKFVKNKKVSNFSFILTSTGLRGTISNVKIMTEVSGYSS